MDKTTRRLKHRSHYTTGLILFLLVLFGVLYLLIQPLSALDESLVNKLPLEFPGLFNLMVAISSIGSPVGMSIIAVGWALVEYLSGRRDRALVMALSLLSAPVFSGIKALVHRARPASEYVEKLNLHSYSFPSGHATMSFAILLTLAYLLSLRLPKKTSRLITATLIIVVILIGFSRVYLQVHYPTDVVGGWIIGAIVLLLIRGYVATYEHISDGEIKA